MTRINSIEYSTNVLFLGLVAISGEIATLLAGQKFAKNRAPVTTDEKKMLVEMRKGWGGAVD